MKRFSSNQKVPYKSIVFGNNNKLVVCAELADTDDKRQKGLSGIDNLGPYEGMLFDFQRDMPVTMWMRGCLIDLDAAFINSIGIIVKTANMSKADPYKTHSCIGVRYVLEVRSGFLEDHNIKINDRIKII